MDNNRKIFIAYFFGAISKLRYAYLKFAYQSINEIPESSDIDLLIDKHELNRFLDIIRKGENIEKVDLHRKSYVTFVSVYFTDGTYLELDLINRFERKGIVYLDSETVLNHSIKRGNLILAAENHNFEYVMLFNLINGSDVPHRYRDYYSSFNHSVRSEIFAYLCNKYDLSINLLDELYDHKLRGPKKILRQVYDQPINKGIPKFLHKIRYFGDMIRDAVNSKGITVTFSGVDGAGKSTVIENVRVTLQKKYRQKTVVLRHRPSLLPILSSIKHGKKKAESLTSQNLPRQGNNTSTISSLIRFMYYYFDYIIGQYYIYFRYTLRGYTVLYDRYYFDFIIDSKRSNITLPKPILKWCYYFVFKPNVNVFLYAPPEIILSRKQEMSKNDIQQLTGEYRQLFDELGKSNKKQHYISINNTNLDETLSVVMKQCVMAAV
jgi:thymidylate kinase